MINGFLNFFKKDLRWKLTIISKITGIKIFPDYFHTKGLRGLYTKFIISLLLKEKIKPIKKKVFQSFFTQKKYSSNKKINFLISTPSSGSTFVRLMMQSYFELLHNVGNGIPKYDNINNFMFFSASQLDHASLWNQIDSEIKKISHTKYLSDTTYEKQKFVISRYPLERIDLYKFNQIKPVVIFRNPSDQILSSYISHIYYDVKNGKFDDKNINYKLIENRIDNYKKYIFFWENYFKSHKKNDDFMIINYKNLLDDTNETFKKILNFYNYEINENYIDRCVQIHSTENTKKYLGEIKIYNKIRFTDPETKKKQRELILPVINNKLKETNILTVHNNLFNDNH